MNMTTTALWLRAASASEKVFPSTVVRVNPGAGAPTWGAAARRACDRIRPPASRRDVRAGRMEDSPFTASEEAGTINYSRTSTSLAVRSLPRREPPPSLRSGDYSRRELLGDGGATSSVSAFDRGHGKSSEASGITLAAREVSQRGRRRAPRERSDV